MFEFLTGFIGMFVALVLLSVLGVVLILGPVMPAINDILNYGPITILVLVVWLFFTMITAKCASGIAKAMTNGKRAHSGLLIVLLVTIVSLIPHGFGWIVVSALIGEGDDYASTMHQIVNTADIIVAIGVFCLACGAATMKPDVPAATTRQTPARTATTGMRTQTRTAVPRSKTPVTQTVPAKTAVQEPAQSRTEATETMEPTGPRYQALDHMRKL